eukprot:jgi/Psemu1/306508/fgenesh1_kg.261_\
MVRSFVRSFVLDVWMQTCGPFRDLCCVALGGGTHIVPWTIVGAATRNSNDTQQRVPNQTKPNQTKNEPVSQTVVGGSSSGLEVFYVTTRHEKKTKTRCSDQTHGLDRTRNRLDSIGFDWIRSKHVIALLPAPDRILKIHT